MGSRLLPVVVLGSCPGAAAVCPVPAARGEGLSPHAPPQPSWALTHHPLHQPAAAFFPGHRACAGWTVVARASERAQCSRVRPGVAGLGAEAARGLTAFVFFAQASRASRRAASPTTARPGKTITENRVSAAAFLTGRPRSQLPSPQTSRSMAPVTILSSTCACVTRSQCSPLSPSAPLCQTRSSLCLWASPSPLLPVTSPSGLHRAWRWVCCLSQRGRALGTAAWVPSRTMRPGCRPAGVLFPVFPPPALFGHFRAGEDERDVGTSLREQSLELERVLRCFS